MRKAFFATLIGAAFVMGGGLAGAAFIRYVAAPVTIAPKSASTSKASPRTLTFAPAVKAESEACITKNLVCDAAFAAFMLKAVLGANGAGGKPLAALQKAAAPGSINR